MCVRYGVGKRNVDILEEILEDEKVHFEEHRFNYKFKEEDI